MLWYFQIDVKVIGLNEREKVCLSSRAVIADDGWGPSKGEMSYGARGCRATSTVVDDQRARDVDDRPSSTATATGTTLVRPRR